MFENLEPTHTTSISTTGYTITDGTLEPGEYWVGNLTTLINPKSPLPLETMVLDTIAKVGAAEPRLGGVTLTYEGKEAQFLVDKPTFPGDMYVRISDDTVVDASGFVVEVDTYTVVMPVTQVTVPDDNMRRHLQDNGVFLTFTEPVSVSNAVCLHFFNKDGSRIVAEVM